MTVAALIEQLEWETNHPEEVYPWPEDALGRRPEWLRNPQEAKVIAKMICLMCAKAVERAEAVTSGRVHGRRGFVGPCCLHLA